VIYALMFSLCLGMGFYVWNRYRARKLFFASVVAFCDHMAIEISFSRDTIQRIIAKYGDSYTKHFRVVLQKYLSLIENKQDITRERIMEIQWTNLKANELTTITDLFYDLGRHGVFEEGKKIAGKRQIFDTFFNEAKEKFKTDASIYLKLFILMGIGAVILLL